jgi:uncharacterized membrane protein YgcG
LEAAQFQVALKQVEALPGRAGSGQADDPPAPSARWMPLPMCSSCCDGESLMWWSIWWVWIVAGFLLGMLEIIVPGYIFLGFAIGAVVTGILVGIGFAPASPACLC